MKAVNVADLISIRQTEEIIYRKGLVAQRAREHVHKGGFPVSIDIGITCLSSSGLAVVDHIGDDVVLCV